MLLSHTILSALRFPISREVRDPCTSLPFVTSFPNTTITSAVRYAAGAGITTGADPTCFTPSQPNSVDICRVNGVIATSPTSSVDFEMWLPDVWYGRFLATGNGGLGGCEPLYQSCIGMIHYSTLLVLPLTSIYLSP